MSQARVVGAMALGVGGALITPLICLLALALAVAPAAAADITEVVNGSFEEWTDAGPAGWNLNTHPDLAGSWEMSEDAHSGQRALLLRPGEKRQCHVYQWHFPVSRGALLLASAWVKGQGTAGLLVYTYDAKHVFNGSASGAQTAAGDEYSRISFCYAP
ncbi:MAG TPA: hypothetical protein VM283_08650, partial [Armatimonadota bacterium]|nr:hypothetical protein [Armatimonadota bacterium]